MAPSHAESFDHSVWDKILGETVHNGVVDYGQIRERYPQLQGYLKSLETADPESLSRREQIAFFINAYNAHCIDGVLSHGEIESVNNVAQFFKKTKFVLAGEVHSLDSLEREVLRKMGEPRIRFAIVCPSKSSPKLASTAYAGGESLERDLERQTKDFFRDPTKNRLDRDKGIFHMSKILKWFKEDLTQNAPSVLAFLKPYLNEEDRAYLEANPRKVKVEYLDYDWSLNGNY